MAESTQTLVFKLTIDGKEVPATLDVIKGEFIETGEAAEKAANKIKEIPEKGIAGLAGTPHLKQFAQDLLQIDTSAEEAAQGIAEFIQINQLNENEIEQVINALRQEQQTMGIATAEYKAHQSAISSLIATTATMRGQQAGLTGGMHIGTHGVNQMRMAMTQFGYTLNDAQVFMVNFRMGLMGISNNIPMIVQNFIQAKNAAGGTATTMQLLTKAIAGGGGLIIGINALMLLINVLPSMFEDTSEEISKTSEETEELNQKIRTLKASFEDLSEGQDEFIKGLLQNQIALTESAITAIENRIKEGGRTVSIAGELQFIPFSESELKDFEDSLSGLESKLEDYNKQLNQGSELVKVNVDLLKGLVEATNNGTAGVERFARENKLSNDQLNNLKSQLKSYYDGISAVGGGLAKELNPGLRELAIRLGLTRGETENAIKVLDEYGKADDSFLKNKQKAVDRFVQEEFRQNEAARLAGLDYRALMEELENAEQEHSAVVRQIIESRNKNVSEEEFDALIKLEEFVESRIDLINEAVERQEELTDKEIEDWRKKRDAILKYQEQLKEARKKFEEERNKFSTELSIRTESDPFERAQKELDAEEQLTLERAQRFEYTEEQITKIKKYYENQRMQIAEEAHQQELDLLQDKINQIQSAYSQIYSIISSNVREEINEWKTKEEKKLEQERKAALSHAHTQAQKDKVNEQFDKRREALQKEADKKAQERLEMWFNLQKALAMSEIAINLAKAISVEWGKLGTFATITQGIIIAALTAQLAVVAAQKFPKGFAEGGRLPKGKAGIIEGTHNELIAPEEDFKTIFKNYSGELVQRALMDYKNFVTINSGAPAREDLSSIKEELTGLKPAIEKMVNDGVRAYLDNRQAKKIGIKASAMNRKSKI